MPSSLRSVFFFGWCGVAMAGCGTDVAQTAEYRAPALVDCSTPAKPAALPIAPPFGDGANATSSLMALGYGPNAGPGIWVVSRDAFRLYANGELLLESAEPLSPRYVAHSFLPGENVVAVAVAGSGRSPLLMLRIDELERSHVTDDTWKTTAAPSSGWTGSGFDDSTWLQASDLGTVDQNASCAAAAAPLVASSVHVIGVADPSLRTAAFRYRFSIAADGFASGTTGGDRAPPTVATDVATFRALVETDDQARVVVLPEGLVDFRPGANETVTQPTCPTACETSSVLQYVVLPTGTACSAAEVSFKRNDRQIHIRSNKTIVGLGRGSQLRGAWFELTGSSNVIFRNLAWFDVNPSLIEAGDGLSLSGSARIWIDHCSFEWISDGFADVTANSRQVTFSWDRFDGQNTFECRGRHLRATEVVDSEATLHHCLWQHVDGRAPFVHGGAARVHLFNDVVMDSLDYAVGSGCGSQVLLEGSYFEDVAAPTSRRDCVESPGVLGLILAQSSSNLYGVGVGAHQSGGASSDEPRDTVFTPPYAYRLESSADIRYRVPERAGAGARWGQPIVRD